MSRARNLADLLDASGDVVSGALDNVPPSNDASALTTGTLPVERVPYVGRRNLIINGGFDVWQRGTSFTTTTAYTADRWHWSNGSAVTVSRTTFASTDNNPGGKYYLRIGANSTSHSTSGVSLRYHIENVTSVAPNTSITLSYWIRSSEVTSWKSQVWERYNGWTDYAQLASHTDTISSSWTKITQTFTTAARTGKTIVDGANTLTLQLQNNSAFTGTNTIDIANVQLEVGSVATPFEYRSYGEELALCQRYYQTGNPNMIAHVVNSGLLTLPIHPTVSFRASPSVEFITSPYVENVPWNSVGSVTLSNTTAAHLTARGGEIGLFGSYSPTPSVGQVWLVNASELKMAAEL